MSMSHTCTTWHIATRDPSLWKDKQFFLFSKHQVPKNIQWLKNHSKHLRHASIMCFGPFDKKRRQFLKHLKKAHLYSLRLNGTAYWWSSGTNSTLNFNIPYSPDDNVIKTILALIQGQRYLRVFQMQQALFPFHTGMSVLTAISQTHCRVSINLIDLEDFFNCDDEEDSRLPAFEKINRMRSFSSCISTFPNLSELTVNSCFVSKSLLTSFAKNRRRKRVTLNIVSWQVSGDSNSRSQELTDENVSDETWSGLTRESFPVRVCIKLQNIKHVARLTESVLQPSIPLHRLDLIGLTATDEAVVGQLIDLLKHVKRFYRTTIVAFKVW